MPNNPRLALNREQAPFSEVRALALGTGYGPIVMDDSETKDDDVYGAPSSDEEEKPSHPRNQPARRTGLDDEKPLGTQNTDLQAVHERIIERERQAQTQKTLSIFEGKKTNRSMSAGHPTGAAATSGASVSRTRSTRREVPGGAHPPANPPAYMLGRSNTVGARPKQLARTLSRRNPEMGRPEVPPGPPPFVPHLPQAPLGTPGVARSNTAVRPPGVWRQKSFRTEPHRNTPPPPYTMPEAATAASGGALAGTGRAMHPLVQGMDALSVQPTSSAPQATYRVFVLNVQRYTVVHLPQDALVQQLLQAVILQMNLAPVQEYANDWTVFDVLSDLPIGTHPTDAERPLREYERVSEVVAARGADAGYFLVKVSEWASLLRADNTPSSSAALGGWVSIQSEPRKWNRRWLELREHALFTASSESVCGALMQGKHAVHLGSMMDMDLYLIDHQRSALTKPYGFALRRVSTADAGGRTVAYATQPDEAAHHDWVKSILGAHTYVLRQERQDLFHAVRALPPLRYPRPPVQPVRRHTYKEPPTARRVRSQRQLAAAPSGAAPLIPSESLSVQFQQGSLLAERERAERADLPHRPAPPRGAPPH